MKFRSLLCGVLGSVLAAGACATSGELGPPPVASAAYDAGEGGSTGTAGTSGAGNVAGRGNNAGNAGRGAASASGGANATGGTKAAAGAKATGGANATGGARATGGANATGGARATGGANAIGGARATGGANATGGARATGGANATGGARATGGSSTVTTGGCDFSSTACQSNVCNTVPTWETTYCQGLLTCLQNNSTCITAADPLCSTKGAFGNPTCTDLYNISTPASRTTLSTYITCVCGL